MNRYFVDANVLLDALLERPDHSEDSIALLAMGAREEVRLLTTPISIGVLLYHLQRSDADKKGLRLQQAQRILAAVQNDLEGGVDRGLTQQVCRGSRRRPDE